MYSQEITRCHRAAIVIAIDQSSSMSEEITFAGRRLTKAEATTIVTSRIIDEMILRATRDSEVRNYYDVALVGYSDDRVYSLLGGEVHFVPVTVLAAMQPEKMLFTSERTMPNGERKMITEQRDVWVRPRAAGTTPLYEMFTEVTRIVEAWCAEPQNSASFPPMVVNITDGETTDASDAMLCKAAARLKATATSDGNTLLTNIHLSNIAKQPTFIFPCREEISLEHRYARLLADMSSEMPESMAALMRTLQPGATTGSRLLMSYNASMTEVLTMINIGSRSLINTK